MNKPIRPVVRVLMAGAALSIAAGCKKNTGEGVSAPPDPVEEMPTGNPPPPPEPVIIGPGNPPPPSPLPTWDESKSGHPEGATNPPRPYLVVTPDGDCYKGWRGAMARPRPGELVGDRVQICEEGADCGEQIQCPEPRTKDLLDAHAKGEAPVGKPMTTKPDGL